MLHAPSRRREAQDLFDLSFVKDATNVALIGPNGVGKTMIAQDLVQIAVTNNCPPACAAPTCSSWSRCAAINAARS